MAIRTTLKAVMQLLIVISFLAFSVAAQILTAQVSTPTSWTNNISLPYANSARIILSDGNATAAFQNKTISSGSNFGSVCAFRSAYDGDGRFFLVVALLTIYTDKYSNLSIQDYANIWSANRNRPVGENAKLQLLVDGNLELRDADGSLVWSTNTSNKSVAGMKMMDTGNLVVYDANNNIVWQSFDHPTDTLLPGQKLVRGQKLVSSVSNGNISEGNFYFSVTSKGVFGFYQTNVPQMYLKLSGENLESIELNYNGSEDIVLYANASAFDVSRLLYQASVRGRRGPFLKFESNGHFILYDSSGIRADDMLTRYLSKCDYPTVCSDYELCSNGMCSCPPGLARDNQTNAQDKSGCSEINATTCENLKYQSLLAYENVYHFSYIDDDAAARKGTDVESCKKECLKNCSCKVALFRYLDNFLLGDCFLPSPFRS
ncbi:EP1-like glycoprotein 2 [Hevea brasiliensis]|uniref:EP1-like glycoprotein 2 n=1 Tax=Hevea brasiliensis TaxID=3981 RepID=UPI0025DDF125|nr:EP1-like glycoprotein 2 [Hevea brasiliensis]